MVSSGTVKCCTEQHLLGPEFLLQSVQLSESGRRAHWKKRPQCEVQVSNLTYHYFRNLCPSSMTLDKVTGKCVSRLDFVI